MQCQYPTLVPFTINSEFSDFSVYGSCGFSDIDKRFRFNGVIVNCCVVFHF